MIQRIISLILVLPVMAGTTRDGTFIDPGITMKTRASGAPQQLDQVTFLIGQWDVVATVPQDGGEPQLAKGHARGDYMNRGHGIMTRVAFDEFSGKPWHTLSFTVYNKAAERWGEGIADSTRLDIQMRDGEIEGRRLVFCEETRPRGGLTTTYTRITKRPDEKGGYLQRHEESTDRGKTWKLVLELAFTPRPAEKDFLTGKTEFGEPHPDRPKASGQNDFLIGKWTASHQMTFPNGQKAAWQARASAIYILDGFAFLEYNAFDTDPNLPDAATSIIRIFNPAQNRWEALYTTNRFNGLLHFGGVMQGEEMVLTTFQSNATDPSISHFVFHSIKKDEYHWYGERSNNGGKTYQKFWIIDFQRQKPPPLK